MHVRAGAGQEALAPEAGMATRYLAGIERGDENPSLAFLMKLSEALGEEPGQPSDRRD